MVTFGKIAATLATFLMALPALAQREGNEADVKAAVIANMMLFVEWPLGGAQVLDRRNLCYLGAGPVTSALAQLDGQLLGGRRLKVIRVDAAAVFDCHALYVAGSEAGPWRRAGPSLNGRGVLLVADSAELSKQGAMVHLDVENGRVVFDVDLRAVQLSGLVLSSKVLRLARQVRD